MTVTTFEPCEFECDFCEEPATIKVEARGKHEQENENVALYCGVCASTISMQLATAAIGDAFSELKAIFTKAAK